LQEQAVGGFNKSESALSTINKAQE